MKKRLLKSISLMLVMVTLVTLFTFTPVTAYAKAGKATTSAVFLKNKKTYSVYDVTGNGKADKIKVVYKTYAQTGDVATAAVYVNGKKKKVFKGGAKISVRLIAPTKKRVYIIPEYNYKGGVYDAYAYKYVKGKFKSCRGISLYAPFSAGKIVSVNSKSFTVKVSTTRYERGLIDEESGKAASFKINYKYDGTKVKRSSSSLKGYANNFTVNKSFWSSTSYQTNNYCGIIFEEGESISITDCYIGGDCFSFKIKGANGSGWLIDDELYDGTDPYFI